jgi:hypothetical protein
MARGWRRDLSALSRSLGGPMPGAVTEPAQRANYLTASIAGLPVCDRNLLHLHCRRGLSVDQVAELRCSTTRPSSSACSTSPASGSTRHPPRPSLTGERGAPTLHRGVGEHHEPEPASGPVSSWRLARSTPGVSPSRSRKSSSCRAPRTVIQRHPR